jgi:hypothetical protein
MQLRTPTFSAELEALSFVVVELNGVARGWHT